MFKSRRFDFIQVGFVKLVVTTLFNLLSDDDGMADYEEFLSGAMKMKNSARCIDAIEILHEQMIAKRHLTDIGRTLSALVELDRS